LPPELIAEKEELFKDRIAIEVKKYLGSNFKKISRALKIARYVEQIIKDEIANSGVLLSAAYLHEAGENDLESQASAREILTKLGAKEGMIEEVCNLIHDIQNANYNKSINHKILHDARLLTELEDKTKDGLVNKEIGFQIESDLFTEGAKKLARKKLSVDGEK
jgi:thymidylate synthase